MGTEERHPQASLPLGRIIALLVVAPASAALGFYAVVHSSHGELTFVVDDLPDAGTARADELDGGLVGAGDRSLEEAATARDATLAGHMVRPVPWIELGEPYYWRCWDAGKQAPLQEDACDRMRPFERVVASRLGLVVKCFERLDRPDAKGVLSLAIELEFEDEGSEEAERGKVSLWSGSSTTLEGADSIISCLRQKLESLPTKGIRHKRQKYTIFFPIEFGGVEQKEGGTSVEVLLERVRLREEPEKGKIIARLERGEPILVFEVREGWAKIKTADGREGWIFLDAITLTEE